MRILVLTAILILHSAASSAASAASEHVPCPPAGHTVDSLHALQTKQFNIDDDHARDQLALGLLACLGHRDPQLRDAIALTAISQWLRAKQLSQATRDDLRQWLLEHLNASLPSTDQGFQQPFVALVLSEVVRADRLDASWDSSTLATVLDAALQYVAAVRDLRGFDTQDGWRHGVAHGADLLLQLAVHRGTDAIAHRRILQVLAGAARPAQTHFYIYGESQRLARPALLIAERKTLSAADWSSWLAQISQPPAGSSWADSYNSQSALALRHNVSGVLHALLAGSHAIKDPALTALVLEHLDKL
jgi:hypothetical protein